jgi:hypothetical protein
MHRLTSPLRRGLPLLLCTMLLLVGLPAKQSCCCVAKAERLAAVERTTRSCCSPAPEAEEQRSQGQGSDCDDCKCQLDAAPEVPLGPLLEGDAPTSFAAWLGPSRPRIEPAIGASPLRVLARAARDRAPPGPLYLRLCSFRC